VDGHRAPRLTLIGEACGAVRAAWRYLTEFPGEPCLGERHVYLIGEDEIRPDAPEGLLRVLGDVLRSEPLGLIHGEDDVGVASLGGPEGDVGAPAVFSHTPDGRVGGVVLHVEDAVEHLFSHRRSLLALDYIVNDAEGVPEPERAIPLDDHLGAVPSQVGLGFPQIRDGEGQDGGPRLLGRDYIQGEVPRVVYQVLGLPPLQLEAEDASIELLGPREVWDLYCDVPVRPEGYQCFTSTVIGIPCLTL